MTTLVGTQKNFAYALTVLLELEYDALEAYELAVDKLDNPDYKKKLKEFSIDHDRHIQQLSTLLTEHTIEFNAGPDIKQWLTKGKVMFANFVSDEYILYAMLTNEIDTNKAYETILSRDDMWSDAIEILANAKEDETRHHDWLDENSNKQNN